MNYELWSIVMICGAAAAVAAQTVYLVISRRRAQRLGILRVKYPIWGGGTALSAFVALLGVIMIILCAVEIPRELANLADYRAELTQGTKIYDYYVGKAESSLARNRFQLVWGIAVVVLELLSIFTRGAYITKDGVMFLGGMKVVKTTARIEHGAINFYTGKKRQRYAFDLPETDDNKELFKCFIVLEEPQATES